jgi:hypothetical protein
LSLAPGAWSLEPRHRRPGRGQGQHRQLLLAADAQGLAGGDQAGEGGHLFQEAPDEECAGLHKMFVVVQHQEPGSALQVGDNLLLGGSFSRTGERESAGDGVRDACGISEVGEGDERDRRAEEELQATCGGDRQSGLARAPWSGEGDQAGHLRAKEARQLGDLFLASEEARELHREGRLAPDERRRTNDQRACILQNASVRAGGSRWRGLPGSRGCRFRVAGRWSVRDLGRRSTHRGRGFRDHQGAGAAAQLLDQGARFGGGRLAQLRPQDALQLLILSQDRLGLTHRGVEAHQEKMSVFPQRIRLNGAAGPLHRGVAVAHLLPGKGDLAEGVEVALGQVKARGEHPLLVGARQQLAAVEVQGCLPEGGTLGQARCVRGGIESGGELPDVRRGAGAQSDQSAIGDDQRNVGPFWGELAAKGTQKNAKVVASRRRLVHGPEQLDEEIAGMGTLPEVGEVGEQRGRSLQGEPGDDRFGGAFPGSREPYSESPQELNSADALHGNGPFAAERPIPYRRFPCPVDRRPSAYQGRRRKTSSSLPFNPRTDALRPCTRALPVPEAWSTERHHLSPLPIDVKIASRQEI